MEENKEMNNNQELNQEEKKEGNVNPAPQEQMEEVTVIEVSPRVAKFIKGAKKVAKFVIPVATAAVGAFVGIKAGARGEARRSKAETDALNDTISDLRNQLDNRPLEIPTSDDVSEVPFSEVIPETVSE